METQTKKLFSKMDEYVDCVTKYTYACYYGVCCFFCCIP